MAWKVWGQACRQCGGSVVVVQGVCRGRCVRRKARYRIEEEEFRRHSGMEGMGGGVQAQIRKVQVSVPPVA